MNLFPLCLLSLQSDTSARSDYKTMLIKKPSIFIPSQSLTVQNQSADNGELKPIVFRE